MQQGDDPRESVAENIEQRRRRDHRRCSGSRATDTLRVPGRAPAHELVAEDQPGLTVSQHERRIGQCAEIRTAARRKSLRVQSLIDGART